MQDFLGNELHENDNVVYIKGIRTGSSTKRNVMFYGKIVGFTTKQVIIKRLYSEEKCYAKDEDDNISPHKIAKIYGGVSMTVDDLIKRLEKIDKDKMCIHREAKDSIGWANIEIEEKENEVTIYGDCSRPFGDD